MINPGVMGELNVLPTVWNRIFVLPPDEVTVSFRCKTEATRTGFELSLLTFTLIGSVSPGEKPVRGMFNAADTDPDIKQRKLTFLAFCTVAGSPYNWMFIPDGMPLILRAAATERLNLKRPCWTIFASTSYFICP